VGGWRTRFGKRKKLPARRHRSFGEHRYVVLAYMRRRRLTVEDIPSSIAPSGENVNVVCGLPADGGCPG